MWIGWKLLASRLRFEVGLSQRGHHEPANLRSLTGVADVVASVSTSALMSRVAEILEDELHAVEGVLGGLLEAVRVQPVESVGDVRVLEVEGRDQLLEDQTHLLRIDVRAAVDAELVEPEQPIGRAKDAELGDDPVDAHCRSRRVGHGFLLVFVRSLPDAVGHKA